MTTTDLYYLQRDRGEHMLSPLFGITSRFTFRPHLLHVTGALELTSASGVGMLASISFVCYGVISFLLISYLRLPPVLGIGYLHSLP